MFFPAKKRTQPGADAGRLEFPCAGISSQTPTIVSRLGPQDFTVLHPRAFRRVYNVALCAGGSRASRWRDRVRISRTSVIVRISVCCLGYSPFRGRQSTAIFARPVRGAQKSRPLKNPGGGAPCCGRRASALGFGPWLEECEYPRKNQVYADKHPDKPEAGGDIGKYQYAQYARRRRV